MNRDSKGVKLKMEPLLYTRIMVPFLKFYFIRKLHFYIF